MAEALLLPKPKILLKMIFTHNQTMEILTDRYTDEELDKILGGAGFSTDTIAFWGCDENGKPARVAITRPDEMLGYILLDYESFASLVRRAQMAQGVAGGPRRQ